MKGVCKMLDCNTCRWCKWFKDGCCINETAFDAEIDLFDFSESGKLSEAINEGFGNIEFEEVEKLLASKVSKKTQAAVIKLLHEEFEVIKVNLVEGIDDSVSTALNSYIKNNFYEGVYIVDPNKFSCKFFW